MKEKCQGLFSASIIAEYFLSKDNSLKEDVMKTLKLVYISHGFFLAKTDIPLIKENVMAWQYGPVIPELYFQLKANSLQINSIEKQKLLTSTPLTSFLDKVYVKYRKYKGIELSNLTHQEGTPWDVTVNEFKSHIENSIIKQYYLKLIAAE